MNRDLLLTRFSPTWLGRILECHEVLASTNDRARELLDEMGPRAHGAVIFADGQTGGRGRMGRGWQSSPGLGLAVSVALWPEGPAEALACLPLAGSLAVLRALLETAGLQPRLKWPNDVLVDGRKISGILVESRLHGDRAAGLVVGIGVNLFQREADFPEDLRTTATSLLLASGKAISPEAFAASLLDHLSIHLAVGLDDPPSLIASAAPHWVHRQGDTLRVALAGTEIVGTYEGVGPDGSLQLDVDGRRRAVHYGDVTRVRPAGA